uniref:HECT domain-containing protein n=1 Tax=Periophthalmus magnuspinnatus TaxID=409849 RepID=A0A3B3Z826_9GOBI
MFLPVSGWVSSGYSGFPHQPKHERPSRQLLFCKPKFCEEGTTKRTLEQDIINHFQDHLQELEDGGKRPINAKPLTVPALLQWMTDQAHKPSERNDGLRFMSKFNHFCQDHEICFPVVSACTNTITFPVAHVLTYSEFKHVLSLAVRFGNAFNRV